MSFWDRIASYAARRSKKPVPGHAGTGISHAVAFPDGKSFKQAVDDWLSGLQWLKAKFPFQFYSHLEDTFLVEPYLRKFKADTVGLGNQGHELEIDASSERRARQAVDICNSLLARCFPHAGGGDGLINAGLGQISVVGGLCGEWVPTPDLREIERAELIRFGTLRFKRDSEGRLVLGQLQQGEFIELNMVQTSFLAAEVEPGNPYPIPPAIAAIQPLVTHSEFQEGIRKWIEKLGSMGVLLALIKASEMDYESGETNAQYRQRTSEELKQFTEMLKESFKFGVGAAYDTSQMKYTNTVAGASGAEKIADIVLHSVFAALLRDPLYFGFNYGTTETLATVLFRILCAQIRNYQRLVKRFMEHGLRLELALKGMGDVGVSVSMNLKDVLDEFQAAEAELMRDKAPAEHYVSGIATLEEVREKLGYEEQSAKAGAYIASFRPAHNDYVLLIPKQWPGADLNTGAQWDGTDMGLAPSKRTTLREALEANRKYLRDVQRHLSSAAKMGIAALVAWGAHNEVVAPEIFAAEAVRHLLNGYQDKKGAETGISQEILIGIAREHLATIWKYAKYDDPDILPDWDLGPRNVGVVLGDGDWRAISYLSRVDSMYMSKFVSGDERTRAQLQKFIEQHILKSGLGTTPKEMERFFAGEFAELFNSIGLHRSRVIVQTGAARAQSWGGILGMQESGQTVYRVSGPWDNLTCEWCRALKDKRFSVATDAQRIEQIIASGSEDISQFGEFLTSRYRNSLFKEDNIKGHEALWMASAEEIQATGLAAPPIHPLCRHRPVAVVQNRNTDLCDRRGNIVCLTFGRHEEELPWAA